LDTRRQRGGCLDVTVSDLALHSGAEYRRLHVGYVNNVYGIGQSASTNAQSGESDVTYTNKSLVQTIKTISVDPNILGQVYVGFMG